jgi:hypothetical protein
MKPDSGNTLFFRLVLLMIGLALLGSLIAGAEYTEDILPTEKAVAVHQGGIGALFFNKCLYICSLSYDLCRGNNPYKNPFHEGVCRKERETCNVTCEESHTAPP